MQLGFVAEEEAEKQELFGLAAKYYTEAADTYFKDDEHHVYFLKIALEAHWWRGDPLRITLPLCARIRAAIPDMKKIWELYLQKMESEYQMVLEFETAYLKEIDAGNLTLNEVGRPEYMVSSMIDSQFVVFIENLPAARYHECAFICSPTLEDTGDLTCFEQLQIS
jgi:hypothetical protein